MTKQKAIQWAVAVLCSVAPLGAGALSAMTPYDQSVCKSSYVVLATVADAKNVRCHREVYAGFEATRPFLNCESGDAAGMATLSLKVKQVVASGKSSAEVALGHVMTLTTNIGILDFSQDDKQSGKTIGQMQAGHVLSEDEAAKIFKGKDFYFSVAPGEQGAQPVARLWLLSEKQRLHEILSLPHCTPKLHNSPTQ